MSNSDKSTKPYMSDKDFKIKNEIMVTITLGEYRSLVEYKASHDGKLYEAKRRASDAESGLNELQKKYDKLKDEFDSLSAERNRMMNDEREW